MRIYFSGIGGVGIGPLAEIARDAGYEVLGSDLTKSLTTDELEGHGITVSYDQSGKFLRNESAKSPIDWFVYTAALPNDHPELVTAQEIGLRTAKRDELLAHIIHEKNLKLIAVAGTHGKTTATGMMVWALKQLDVPVSYSIGTTLSWGPSGHFDPNSEYFVYECDEFDRNFLHFHPHLSIITSIDYDHPDTYPTADEYYAAFSQFISQSQQVVMWAHDLSEIEAAKDNWILGDDEVRDIHIAGAHNRRNATLVAKGIEYLLQEKADEALAHFPGTNRRFEKIAENLYTDYGHHPAEIAATLQMAKELSDHIVLVYQPHQNTRQHEIREAYLDDVFKDADEVYWLPTYLSREDANLAILSPEELTRNITRKDSLHFIDLDNELSNAIQKARDAGKLVLCMGAGSIDGWLRQNSK